MERGPLSSIGNLPAQPYDAGQLVAATRALNHAQSLGQGRTLRLRRGGAGNERLRIQVVDRDTGEVMDELAPEAILRMMRELEKQQRGNC